MAQLALGFFLIPGAPLVAAKLALLLALLCAVGGLLRVAADALLGGTDDLE